MRNVRLVRTFELLHKLHNNDFVWYNVNSAWHIIYKLYIINKLFKNIIEKWFPPGAGYLLLKLFVTYTNASRSRFSSFFLSDGDDDKTVETWDIAYVPIRRWQGNERWTFHKNQSSISCMYRTQTKPA